MPVQTQHAGIRRWLLYDHDCSLCRRWCEWATRRGAGETITFMPCQSAAQLRSRASIADHDCARYAILIEEAADSTLIVQRAAAAVNAVLAQLPGPRNLLWRALSTLYRVPGIRQLEDLSYALIAHLR